MASAVLRQLSLPSSQLIHTAVLSQIPDIIHRWISPSAIIQCRMPPLTIATTSRIHHPRAFLSGAISPILHADTTINPLQIKSYLDDASGKYENSVEVHRAIQFPTALSVLLSAELPSTPIDGTLKKYDCRTLAFIFRAPGPGPDIEPSVFD
jgi:hypothetical protein